VSIAVAGAWRFQGWSDKYIMSIIVDKYLDTSEKRKEAKGGSAGKKTECFSIALSGRLILVKYLQKHVIY
jgi:hypothetical protein